MISPSKRMANWMADTTLWIRNLINFSVSSAASAKAPTNIPYLSLIPTSVLTIKKDISERSQIVSLVSFAFAIVHSKLSSSYFTKKLPLQNAHASLNLYNLDAV